MSRFITCFKHDIHAVARTPKPPGMEDRPRSTLTPAPGDFEETPLPTPIIIQPISDLITPHGANRIEYIGSATSHFQSEPLLEDNHGEPLIRSDWEYEVSRRVQGAPSGIPKSDINSLPSFLKKRDEYIRRSAELSENMFRIALDFGRLCPREGEFDELLMTEYIRTLALIRKHGQEPFLTLHHFTFPKWAIRIGANGNITAGGWDNPRIVQHFRFYIQKVADSLADEDRIHTVLKELNFDAITQDRILSEGLCNYFMTINEPAAVLSNSYLTGIFPPYSRGNLPAMLRVLNVLVQAHDIAFDTLKQSLKRQAFHPQIGVGHNSQEFRGLLGWIAREFQEHCMDRFERNGNHSDFLGLHYYFRYKLPLMPGEKRKLEYGDQPTFGDIYPPGIFGVIKRTHSTYPCKQIFISEFGFSDRTDRRRPYWLLETIRYILLAFQEGIPIKGILLWTLVDNFEWEFGMSQKFGLFNERELGTPLDSFDGTLKSWHVWRAVVTALMNPTFDNLRKIEQYYDAAYAKYKRAGGVY